MRPGKPEKAVIDTFIIDPGGGTITCKRCCLTSFNPQDVEHHYCAFCDQFHDDIWPPAREYWIAHPPADAPMLGPP